MRIPKSLQVGERNVIIKYENKETKTFNMVVAAWCDKFNNIIYINNDLSEETKEKLFWHESIHMILEEMGEKELGRNEEFVERLSDLTYKINLQTNE